MFYVEKEYLNNSSIDWNWGDGNILNSDEKNNIGLVIKTNIYPKITGRYLLKLESINGIQLIVNNKNMINKLTSFMSETSPIEFLMQENVLIPIEIKFLCEVGKASLRLLWKTPDSNKFIVIPSNNLLF